MLGADIVEMRMCRVFLPLLRQRWTEQTDKNALQVVLELHFALRCWQMSMLGERIATAALHWERCSALQLGYQRYLQSFR